MKLHKNAKKALHSWKGVCSFFKQGTQCLDTLRSHHRRNHCQASGLK